MMHVRKESWKDITQKAQEAVYSDMEITLHLNYRKLRCLRGGLRRDRQSDFVGSLAAR